MSLLSAQRDDPKVVSFFACRPRQTELITENATPRKDALIAI